MENPALKWGLIAGLGVMITSLVFYLIDVELFFSASSYFGWVIYLVCMVFAVKEQRTALGGINFKEAFSAAFIAFVIGSLMYHVFYFLMFNVVDPGLADVQKEMTLEAMESFSGLLDEAQMEEAIARIENQDIGIGTIGMAFLVNLIFPGAIMAAIIALVMKKDKPAVEVV